MNRPPAAITPLLIRFGRIGDMVLQAPLLQLLSHRYGRPCRLLSAGTWSSELYATHPDVREVWQLRARYRPFLLSPERWRLVSLLARHDGPVYVSEDVPHHVARIRELLARAGIAARRCAFLGEQHAQEHWVERLLRFGNITPGSYVEYAHVHANTQQLAAPRLYVDAQSIAACRAWLRERGAEGRPVVLIQPGNKRVARWNLRRKPDTKAWPERGWGQLLHSMRATLPDAYLLLCGSRAEQGLLERICAGSGNIAAVATHELPLRRALALMSIAHSMVGVDSGPAHMAAAVGCPLLVLYGDESPRVWGRRGAAGQRILELGGPPAASVSQIEVAHVIGAWQSIAATVRASTAAAA